MTEGDQPKDGDGSLLDGLRSRYLVRLAAIAVVILLLMVGLGANSIVQINDTIREDTKQSLRKSSGLQASGVNQWALSVHRQARLVSESGEFDADPTAISEYFDSLLDRRDAFGPTVLAVHYVETGSNGSRIVASSEAELIGDQWEGASSGEVGDARSPVTDPYLSSISSDRVLAFVTPVPDRESRVLAVVVSTERAARRHLSAEPSGRAFVLDGDGTVLLSSRDGLVGDSAGELSANGSLLSVPSGTSSYVEGLTVDGQPQATGAAGLTDFSWVAVSQQPTSAAFSLSRTVFLLVALLLGGLVMSYVLFLAVISRGAIADVRDLASKAALVAREGADADVTLETDREDEIGTLVESIDEMQSSLGEQITGLEALNRRMTDAVESQSAVLDACADGDLTRRMDTDTGVDQLDSLAAEFNDMMDKIRTSIRGAMEFSYAVATASSQASSAVHETKESSVQVARDVREISEGTERQSEELGATVGEMDSFTSSIDDVATFAEDLSKRSAAATETAEGGRESAREAAGKLDTIEAETDRVVEDFGALQEEIDTIEEIADSIRHLAEQTDTIAVNAGVDAARSDKGGSEDFGIVVQEIQEFARETQTLADDIEQRLEAIQDRTEKTGESIEDAQAAIDEGTTTIQDALDALDEVAETIEGIDDSIGEVDEVTDQQNDTARQLLERIQTVAKIAQKNAQKSEDVAGVAEDQSDSIDEIDDTVSQLESQAEKLYKHLDQFAVESGDETASAGD